MLHQQGAEHRPEQGAGDGWPHGPGLYKALAPEAPACREGAETALQLIGAEGEGRRQPAPQQCRQGEQTTTAGDGVDEAGTYAGHEEQGGDAGVTGIIIAKDRSAPLRGAVAKASAGAIAHLRVCQVTNLPAALQQLKKAGLWVFGTTKDANLSLYDADFNGPLCLVMGSEEKGLRPLVRKQCDFLVSIPMQGGLDSLNASTAAAVVLFEIVRQRIQRQ